MIANYHTHTYRCKHCSNVPDEWFVQAAIQRGLKILGFSDHIPWPYHSNQYELNIRMELEELPRYVQSIRCLQDKYQDQIKIYLGLECEYYPAYADWLDTVKGQVDYLILGNHWPLTDEYGAKRFARSTNAEELQSYFSLCIEAIRTGSFMYIAHPDHIFSSYQQFDNVSIDGSYSLCRTAKELGIPLEYNVSGYGLQFSGLGYPVPQFWEIAKDVGCTAIIGCDAHNPEALRNTNYTDRAERYLMSMGIDLVETLNI